MGVLYALMGVLYASPGEFFSPEGQELHIRFGELLLAVSPRHLFNLYTTGSALNPAHSVKKEDSNTPEGNKLETTLSKVIVARCRPLAA